MIERLANGEVIRGYREGGNSMTPIIKSRQPVDIHPITDSDFQVGNVVFCKVHGKFFMHKITSLDGNRVQIGNNHGHINGWTTRDRVYGRVIP